LIILTSNKDFELAVLFSYRGRKMLKLLLKIILLPYTILWYLGIWTIKLLGRLISFILGVFLIIIGIVLSLTLVAAILGIPLIFAGLSIVLRSLF